MLSLAVKNYVLTVLLIGSFSEAKTSTGNEISLLLWLLEFSVYFFFTVKAFFGNKEELSNWFSPRVVGGFFQGHLDQKSQCSNVLNDCFSLLCVLFYFCISNTCEIPKFVFSEIYFIFRILNVWLWEWAFNYMGVIRRNW